MIHDGLSDEEYGAAAAPETYTTPDVPVPGTHIIDEHPSSDTQAPDTHNLDTHATPDIQITDTHQ